MILDTTKKLFYPIDSTIQIEQEALDFGISEKGNFLSRKVQFFKDIQSLKKKLQSLRPNIIISTEYQFTIAAYFATRNMGVKLMAWEHHHFYGLKKNRFWQTLYSFVYPKLDKVICLNAAEEKIYQSISCKTTVIPNFVSQNTKSSLDKKNLLTIGWLTKLKGVDMIPLIAQKVFTFFPDWHWNIIGSGAEEGWLKAELQKRNLSNNVSILAPVSHVLDTYYQNSSLYVLLSRVECFPMVLLESASHGVPSVAFNCPTGPGAILHHGQDGLLVQPENADDMATAIITLLKNNQKRKALGENSYLNMNRFATSRIYSLWEKLFAEL